MATSTELAMEGGTAEDRLLAGHLERAGYSVATRAWDCDESWDPFDLVLLRSCWDYHLRPVEFGEWLARLESLAVQVWNPIPLVRWNMDKHYLRDLSARGVEVVPTTYVDRPASSELLQEILATEAEAFVVKPAVGATAFQCRRVSRKRISSELTDLDPARSWLVQPFLREIVDDGEWSLVWLGGRFSHAVVKRAGGDDFRVQKDWGGTSERVEAKPEIVDFAGRVLSALEREVLYARVDVVRRGDRYLLMELELIEPELFLEPGDPGLDLLVQSLVQIEE